MHDPSAGLVAVRDADWQYPAITEQHACRRILADGNVPAGVTYVAWPWATLIDRLDRSVPEAAPQLAAFHAFCRGLPQDMPKVTVCQHIGLRRHLPLFAEAGIGDIFWSHATPADLEGAGVPRLHPFPLYPVQVTTAAPPTDVPRRWLFCFVGARARPWYLTQVRDWILEDLAADPRGRVIGRDTWHYNRVVYDHQIAGTAEDPGSLVDDAISTEFVRLLRNSTFALCPSGSGPNSIRLWEAIGAGAIPVILSDNQALPGDPALWARAALRCPETRAAVRALPDRLAALAADPAGLAARRNALQQIWQRYGPDSFVPDVQALMRSLAPPAPAPSPRWGLGRLFRARSSFAVSGRSAPTG